MWDLSLLCMAIGLATILWGVRSNRSTGGSPSSSELDQLAERYLSRQMGHGPRR